MAIRAFVTALLALLVQTPAWSAITFSTRAEFNQATQFQTTADFSGLASGPLCGPVRPYTTDPCILQTVGITFVSTIGIQYGDMYGQRPLLSAESWFGNMALFSNQIPKAPDEFYFEFEGDAFGLDLITGATFGSPISVHVAGPGSVSEYLIDATTSGTFFGATLDEIAVWRISLFVTNSNFLIDNVTTAAAVPEPSVLLLFGIGLALMIAGHYAPGSISPSAKNLC